MTRFFKLISIALLIAVVICAALPINAQTFDTADPGSGSSNPAYVHFGVGYYYQLRENHQRAIEEFTEAILLLPELGNFYTARGDSYAAIGEYDLAILDYNIAIEIYPDFVSALYTRGRAYHAIGEIELAIADYEEAIGQWPEYALPYWGLGDIYFEQTDLVSALDNYEIYLEYVGQYPTEAVADITVLARTQQLREDILTPLT
ncbi:MAG: tetratricopeptide repeat protein [Anaerolineae bacterium]|nr:tetratricopeptide repeat protein [Anaerolineae bacterium]